MPEDDVELMEDIGPVEPVDPAPISKPYVFPHATSAEWLAQDPILADGAMGIEFDPFTGMAKAKVGYQGKRWSQLPYLGETPAAPGLNATVKEVPAPEVPGKVLLSTGPSGMLWGDIDPGYFGEPSPTQPRVLRAQFGAMPGPPATLPEGVLAINLSGHVSGESRAAIYFGGPEGSVKVFSQVDTQAFVRLISQVLRGGLDVADAMNQTDVPVTLANGDLLVVYYTPEEEEAAEPAAPPPSFEVIGFVYLFTAPAGRYGAVNYTGEGGPGMPVTQSQFFPISQRLG